MIWRSWVPALVGSNLEVRSASVYVVLKQKKISIARASVYLGARELEITLDL